MILDSNLVYLIYAGGTFGSHGTPLKPLPSPVFLPILQELINKKITNKVIVLDNDIVKDSSALTPSDFVHFYQLIKNAYQKGLRRCVLLTGTDSLSFVSAFLANALVDLPDLSLIITGAMQSLLISDALPYVINDDSDAWQNLSNSIANLTNVGVMVHFFGQTFWANNTQKLHSHDNNAFVGTPIQQSTTPKVYSYPPTHHAILTNPEKIDAINIRAIYLLPNNPNHLIHELSTIEHNVDAVILIAFGAGNITKTDKLIAQLENLYQRQIPVICTSMCMLGGVSTTYQAGSWQYQHGVLSGGELGVAGIYGKLLWLIVSGNLNASAWNGYESPSI